MKNITEMKKLFPYTPQHANMIRCGITDLGEPAATDIWMDSYEYFGCKLAIIVSKGMPSEKGQQWMLDHKNTTLFHAGITGWEGTEVQCGTASTEERFAAVEKLIKAGFPRDHVVIRVDPVLLTKEGIKRAWHVMQEAARRGFTAIKYSWCDVFYQHAQARWQVIGFKKPFDVKEPAGRVLAQDLVNRILKLENESNIHFSICAEKNVVGLGNEHHNEGCVDTWAFEKCGFAASDVVGNANQRGGCGCGANKTELIPMSMISCCAHECTFCFVKNTQFDKKWGIKYTPDKKVDWSSLPAAIKKYKEEKAKKEITVEKTAFRNDKAFLSNMFPIRMIVNGIEYTCLEAAFQSFKTTDLDERKKFSGISGKEAKALGRRIKLRKDWESWKEDCMLQLLRIKFSDPDMTQALLSVEGDIVETNNWNDTYWGVCNGVGKNRLGKLLEQIRTELSCGFKVWKGFWTPEDCAKHANNVFVFGDNDLRKGTARQAVIRNCANSIGVRTKRLPAMTEDAFYSDLEEEKQKIREDLLKVAQAGLTKTVWLPEAGLGTGLAKLPEKSPMLFKFLTRAIELMKNEGAQAAIDFLNADIK